MLHTHDKFIRNILSNKKIARDYFKNYLPEFVSKYLDFSTLEQSSESYLSEELKKSMSDIVYTCRKKGSKGMVKVSLLIEHKSYPDKYTSIQIGGYIFSALQKQVQNHEPLTVVIPLLLYHGKGKWQYQKLGSLFENMEEELRIFLPDFEYVYNDLGALADDAIEALNNKFLVASFLVLKHSFEKKWIEKNAVELLLLAAQGPRGLQKGFIIYLYSRGRLEEKILNSLPDSIKKDIMNTLDIYLERGKKEGFEKGMEKGMEKGIEKGIEKGKGEKEFEIVEKLILKLGLDDKQVAEVADVSTGFVKKVRAAIRKKK